MVKPPPSYGPDHHILIHPKISKMVVSKIDIKIQHIAGFLGAQIHQTWRFFWGPQDIWASYNPPPPQKNEGPSHVASHGGIRPPLGPFFGKSWKKLSERSLVSTSWDFPRSWQSEFAIQSILLLFCGTIVQHWSSGLMQSMYLNNCGIKLDSCMKGLKTPRCLNVQVASFCRLIATKWKLRCYGCCTLSCL